MCTSKIKEAHSNQGFKKSCNFNISFKNFSKIVVLGRRSTTVPKTYNIDQSAAESEGRLVQVTVGKLGIYIAANYRLIL